MWRWQGLLPVGRRCAAGIDVNRRAVRIVVLSGRVGRAGTVQIETLEAEPLPPHAFSTASNADWALVTAALQGGMARALSACGIRALPGVMALPDGSFAAESFVAPPSAAARGGDALQAAVLVEAERVVGLARETLAVDWQVDSASSPGSITFAVAEQARLDARLDAASAAGVELIAIDGEPYAALRALRHAAALELDEEESYLAFWFGDSGVYGWRIEACMIAAQIRYPELEHADLAATLRGFAQSGAVGCAFVAGDLELFGGAPITLANLGDLLGCIVLPFECAGFCAEARPVNPQLSRAPDFAVAFGLALRGVLE